MSMDILIENPPGTVNTSDIFTPSTTLRIKLTVYEIFGTWTLQPITCYASLVGSGINLYGTTVTDWIGHGTIDLQLLPTTGHATLTVWHEYLAFVGDDKYVTPVGIGTAPGALPQQPDQWAMVKWAGGALVLVSVLYLAAQWAPAVTKLIPERKTRAEAKV